MPPIQDKNQLVGFKHSPTDRGTLDILYTCLPILGTCVWASLHLDMTTKSEAAWKRFFRKVGYMLASLLTPEGMLALAAFEHIDAREAMHTINHFYVTDSSINHAGNLWTLTDGFFSEMRGFRYRGTPVAASRIVAIMKAKKIAPVRSHAKAIRDRSKADRFARLFACTQALWIVIQCLARKLEGLPISLLELGTIGYVLVSIVVYGLLWNKPKDVMTHIDIPSKNSRSDKGDKKAEKLSAIELLRLYPPSPSPPPKNNSFFQRHTEGVFNILLIFCCALYGGYHCLAWNFAFPSLAEKWLWRVSSLTTSLPLLWIAFAARARRYHVHPIVFIVLVPIYVLSRAILVVEMFISLRSMPAGVFETVQWTNFIPHF